MPTSEMYSIGDAPVITINTFDIAGTAADPTGLSVTVDPSGSAAVVYVYGTDAELTRSTTGVYKLAVPVITTAGRRDVKAIATGTNAAAEQSYFWVQESNV